MATKPKMLTATFQDRMLANRAFSWLQDRGYTSSEISLLMSDRTRTLLTQDEGGENAAGSMATEGMATGGAVGTAVGAGIAAAYAISTAVGAVVIPGIGWVAGPIVAALAGGGAGAVAGEALGGLIGFGIPESNAKAYEEALRKGGIVMGVVPHTSEDAKQIEEYFKEHNADNILFV